MNQAVEAVATRKQKPTTYVTVTLDDGRVVDFAGSKRMVKEAVFNADGSIAIRMDFVNGETRIFTLGDALMAKYAAHGALQKLGDELSGLTDVEDCVQAIDELTERLSKGEWGVTRAPGESLAGTSILARAMVEVSGKPMSEVKAFLSTKNQKQKIALRNLPTIAPVIAKLEAAKTRKPKDTSEADAMLDGFIGNGEVAAE